MSKKYEDDRFPPGTRVIVYGQARGTVIGKSKSGSLVVDVGHGTTLADPADTVAAA